MFMKSVRITVLAFFTASAWAQSTTSWVSSTGSDLNPCSRTAPCQTFQHAHDSAATNGIVKAVDAANYGPLNITKSITIDGNGVGAEIDVTAVGGLGINISGGPVTIKD